MATVKIPVEPVEAPKARLCWQQPPSDNPLAQRPYCDRRQGHDGKHSWDTSAEADRELAAKLDLLSSELKAEAEAVKGQQRRDESDILLDIAGKLDGLSGAVPAGAQHAPVLTNQNGDVISGAEEVPSAEPKQ
jgi:hypothetical protein